VFEQHRNYHERITDPTLDVDEKSVLVLKNVDTRITRDGRGRDMGLPPSC